MKIEYLPYFVIGILFLYIVYLKEFAPPPPIPVGDTEVDTLVVTDTLYQDLPTDTVEVSVTIVKYDTIYVDGVEIKEYTSHHNDNRISASWTTGVIGELKYQNFAYSLLKTPVINNTVYIRTKNYVIREKEVSPSYLSVGFEFGGNETMFTAAPSLIYTSQKRNTYFIKYDLMHNAYYLGLTTPLLKF